MEQEKRYNKALERARKELQACGSTDCDAYRQIVRIFPELAESEDERIRKHLIEFLSDLSKLGKNTNFDRWSKADCANWIAWLKKQKPAEWSEDDNETLTDCMSAIRDAKHFKDEDKDELIFWLKSLRPQKQWKPTDEQMKALWEVYQGGEEQSALAGLYNDLKRLKGE